MPKCCPHPPNGAFVSICPGMGTKGKMTLEQSQAIGKKLMGNKNAKKK